MQLQITSGVWEGETGVAVEAYGRTVVVKLAGSEEPRKVGIDEVAVEMSEAIKAHGMFSLTDYLHLRAKGYDETGILAIWDRDEVTGSAPLIWSHEVGDL